MIRLAAEISFIISAARLKRFQIGELWTSDLLGIFDINSRQNSASTVSLQTASRLVAMAFAQEIDNY